MVFYFFDEYQLLVTGCWLPVFEFPSFRNCRRFDVALLWSMRRLCAESVSCSKINDDATITTSNNYLQVKSVHRFRTKPPLIPK